ncbi:gas vesicle protein [Actinomadura alba]|uniref:Gas vesicle protein n=1 Tax=Actinomadura alba TaxID=406431 RepID=A0ABR7LXG2_9ACTN|nr:gas vesicle protein [Actinomadura alba]MBC6469549.1 gas vesicle protein [Actinomadura alba]
MDRVLTGVPVPPPGRSAVSRGENIALVDLLDRLLAGGVVITGDITISIADVDLVKISLRAIIASIRPEMDRIRGEEATVTRLDEHRRSVPSRRERPS